MSERKWMILFGCFFTFCTLLTLAAIGAVVFVVWHFLAKVW